MSYRVRSLSTLYTPLLQGFARPRRRWWLILLVLAGSGHFAKKGPRRTRTSEAKTGHFGPNPASTILLVVATIAFLAGRASGSSGHRCADDWDCPPALTCRAARCIKFAPVGGTPSARGASGGSSATPCKESSVPGTPVAPTGALS